MNSENGAKTAYAIVKRQCLPKERWGNYISLAEQCSSLHELFIVWKHIKSKGERSNN